MLSGKTHPGIPFTLGGRLGHHHGKMNPFSRIALALLLGAMIFTPLLAGPARGEDPLVYSDHTFFSHWSEPAVGVTTEGKQFHGPFGNQPVSLTLDHLPRHRWIRVTFDLYVVGTWDGSSPVWGPDLWSLTVHGGERLIFASLCAWGYAGNNEQSFPDDYPQAIHPAWTGVARHNVVNIQDSEPPKNGVYKVEVLFPHLSDQLTLDFTGSYDDSPREAQVWGIGNVEVSALSEETVTDANDLPGLWEDLASGDSVKANAALWQFVGAGTNAFDFINERIGNVKDDDGLRLSEADNLRMHRAHRIIRILGGDGSHDLCSKMDHLSIEYARKYLGR